MKSMIPRQTGESPPACASRVPCGGWPARRRAVTQLDPDLAGQPGHRGQARATALWLENPGKSPITLQVRIYAWTQRENQNLYAETREVIGSPPIVTIEPGPGNWCGSRGLSPRRRRESSPIASSSMKSR